MLVINLNKMVNTNKDGVSSGLGLWHRKLRTIGIIVEAIGHEGNEVHLL